MSDQDQNQGDDAERARYKAPPWRERLGFSLYGLALVLGPIIVIGVLLWCLGYKL